MLRTALVATLGILAVLLLGAAGAWAYQEYTTYRQMQALFPQIINVVNAHEAVLQKITGAPSLAPPASGAGSGANPPAK